MLAEEFTKREDHEQAVRHALIARACEKSDIIRQRLAAVAEELRTAAATAGSGSDSLLRLASKFERDSKSGDLT